MHKRLDKYFLTELTPVLHGRPDSSLPHPSLTAHTCPFLLSVRAKFPKQPVRSQNVTGHRPVLLLVFFAWHQLLFLTLFRGTKEKKIKMLA